MKPYQPSGSRYVDSGMMFQILANHVPISVSCLSLPAHPASLLGIKRGLFLTIAILKGHVLPSKYHNSSEIEEEGFFLTALGSGDPVVVYMHGNSGSRASTHRIELYQLLSNLGYHVIAFDYRSYGDSTNESPSEQGVVSDSLFVLSWTVERVKGAPLFVWGHSLGTSVSSHSLDILSQKGLHPTGLILEAPFNNMRDEIREHPLARVFRFLPWFDFCFADSVGENNLLFETDKHLRNIRSRVLILHAEDDKIIPFKLAKKLYESTVQGRSPHFGKVKFVKFEGKWGHGHKWICRSPDLPNVIRQFVAED
uniref:Serine aminopeptidase S33 domain-containing protein n=1 Tax=Timema genevievae TaxID=629358 RepID=A0A7R9PJD7_TIMGE|nr:unnamed protein product [Timema genevievae]